MSGRNHKEQVALAAVLAALSAVPISIGLATRLAIAHVAWLAFGLALWLGALIALIPWQFLGRCDGREGESPASFEVTPDLLGRSQSPSRGSGDPTTGDAVLPIVSDGRPPPGALPASLSGRGRVPDAGSSTRAQR